MLHKKIVFFSLIAMIILFAGCPQSTTTGGGNVDDGGTDKPPVVDPDKPLPLPDISTYVYEVPRLLGETNVDSNLYDFGFSETEANQVIEDDQEGGFFDLFDRRTKGETDDPVGTAVNAAWKILTPDGRPNFMAILPIDPPSKVEGSFIKYFDDDLFPYLFMYAEGTKLYVSHSVGTGKSYSYTITIALIDDKGNGYKKEIHTTIKYEDPATSNNSIEKHGYMEYDFLPDVNELSNNLAGILNGTYTASPPKTLESEISTGIDILISSVKIGLKEGNYKLYAYITNLTGTPTTNRLDYYKGIYAIDYYEEKLN